MSRGRSGRLAAGGSGATRHWAGGLLLLAGSRDEPFATSVRTMYARTPPPKTLRLYPTAAHGSDLFGTRHGPAVRREILEFVVRHATVHQPRAGMWRPPTGRHLPGRAGSSACQSRPVRTGGFALRWTPDGPRSTVTATIW